MIAFTLLSLIIGISEAILLVLIGLGLAFVFGIGGSIFIHIMEKKHGTLIDLNEGSSPKRVGKRVGQKRHNMA